MTPIELLIDLHLNGDRQGPGSDLETERALKLSRIDLNRELKIADIGCGTGAQTLTLAKLTRGHITAIDASPVFLKKLNERVASAGMKKRVTSIEASMSELPFQNNEFDLIWSEGAIYNIGFEKGIQLWKEHLKPGGVLAISEISWTTATRPDHIEEFWLNAYEEIDTVSNKLKVLELHGFSPLAHFTLPEYCWMDNYYTPLANRFDAFLVKQEHSKEAQAIVESEKNEIEYYEKFKKYYSYGFYIAKRIQ